MTTLTLQDFSGQSPLFNAYLQYPQGTSTSVNTTQNDGIRQWQVGFDIQLPTNVVNTQQPYLGPFLAANNLPTFTNIQPKVITSEYVSSDLVKVQYDAGRTGFTDFRGGQGPTSRSITITNPANLTITFPSLQNDNGTKPGWNFPLERSYKVSLPNSQIDSIPISGANKIAALNGVLVTDLISDVGVFTDYSLPGNPAIAGRFRICVLIRFTSTDSRDADLAGEPIYSPKEPFFPASFKATPTNRSVPFFIFEVESASFSTSFLLDPFFLQTNGSALVPDPNTVNGGTEYSRIVTFLQDLSSTSTRGILINQTESNTFLMGGSVSTKNKISITYGSYIRLARVDNPNGLETALSSSTLTNKDQNSPSMQYFDNTLWQIQNWNDESANGDVTVDQVVAFKSAPTCDGGLFDGLRKTCLPSNFLSYKKRGGWSPSMSNGKGACEQWKLVKTNDSNPNLYLYDTITIQAGPSNCDDFQNQYLIPSTTASGQRPLMDKSFQLGPLWQVVSSTPIPPSYFQILGNSVVYLHLLDTTLVNQEGEPLLYLSALPKPNGLAPSMRAWNESQIAWRLVFADDENRSQPLRYGDTIRIKNVVTNAYLSASKSQPPSNLSPTVSTGPPGICENWLISDQISFPFPDKQPTSLFTGILQYGDRVSFQSATSSKNCDGQGQKYLRGDCELQQALSPCMGEAGKDGVEIGITWSIDKAPSPR